MAKITVKKFRYALLTRGRVRIEARGRRIASSSKDYTSAAGCALPVSLDPIWAGVRTVPPASQCYPQKALPYLVGGVLSCGAINNRGTFPLARFVATLGTMLSDRTVWQIVSALNTRQAI